MDQPPDYAVVTGKDRADGKHRKSRNGISPTRRRSMEDEMRPLPKGWVRQFDPETAHQYFVDTRATPPRSIWHHPYDDRQYLDGLTAQERSEIQNAQQGHSKDDIVAESSDEDNDDDVVGGGGGSGARVASGSGTGGVGRGSHHPGLDSGSSSAADSSGPVRKDSHPSGLTKFGRKMKDKMTHTTHAERVQKRERRAELERKAYARHQAVRQAMAKAAQTGQPQLVGYNKEGKEVYVQPPEDPYQGGGYGYSPYGRGNYMRPAYPYSRPYGMGYGGGYGMPLAGGLMGGLLLGGLLF